MESRQIKSTGGGIEYGSRHPRCLAVSGGGARPRLPFPADTSLSHFGCCAVVASTSGHRGHPRRRLANVLRSTGAGRYRDGDGRAVALARGIPVHDGLASTTGRLRCELSPRTQRGARRRGCGRRKPLPPHTHRATSSPGFAAARPQRGRIRGLAIEITSAKSATARVRAQFSCSCGRLKRPSPNRHDPDSPPVHLYRHRIIDRSYQCWNRF